MPGVSPRKSLQKYAIWHKADSRSEQFANVISLNSVGVHLMMLKGSNQEHATDLSLQNMRSQE